MDDKLIGTVLEDRYRIEAPLAMGGMGVVYRAERVGIGKPVAVKVLHRSAAHRSGERERFEREAAAMSRLTHPNLVSIIDYGSAEDMLYLVMELHDGVSLRKALERGALGPERAVLIARQLLAGLGSAHRSGVVHRDLKPGNVLLVGEPGEDLVKVLDFGVAKLLDDGTGPSELSLSAGRLLGTPQYMSPEQARCEPVDHRSDLYAVGVILYQMVTGFRPFEAEEDLAVLRKHVEDAPVPPRAIAPAISAELDAVIIRALSKEPADRWHSAAALAVALAAVPEARTLPAPVGLAAPVGSAAPVAPPARGPQPARRRRRRGLLVGLALLAGAAVAVATAAHRGLIELPQPSWSPWASAEPAAADSAARAPVAEPPPAGAADAPPPPADARPADDAAAPLLAEEDAPALSETPDDLDEPGSSAHPDEFLDVDDAERHRAAPDDPGR